MKAPHANGFATPVRYFNAMSVELPISPSLNDAHCAAINEINRWRGHCIQCFAQIELAVAGTLADIAARNPAARKKTAPFFGARIKAIRDVFEAGAPFGTAGIEAAQTLLALQPWLDRRNIIVHSVGKVFVARDGQWIWAYRLNVDGKEETCGAISSEEATRMETELATGSGRLSRLLRRLTRECAQT